MNSVSPQVTSARLVVALKDTAGTPGSGTASETNLPQDLSFLDDTRQQAVVPGAPGAQRLPGDHPWRKCFAERNPSGREGFRGRDFVEGERCVFPHMSGGGEREGEKSKRKHKGPAQPCQVCFRP